MAAGSSPPAPSEPAYYREAAANDLCAKLEAVKAAEDKAADASGLLPFFTEARSGRFDPDPGAFWPWKGISKREG